MFPISFINEFRINIEKWHIRVGIYVVYIIKTWFYYRNNYYIEI